MKTETLLIMASKGPPGRAALLEYVTAFKRIEELEETYRVEKDFIKRAVQLLGGDDVDDYEARNFERQHGISD